MIQLLTDSFRRLLKMFMLANYQGLKWLGFGNAHGMGTHFPGPPFLQSGVPRPQRALFPWERTLPGRKDSFIRENARSQAGKTVLSITNELVNLHLVKISAWPEIQVSRFKIERVHIFFSVPFRSHYGTLQSRYNPWNYHGLHALR